MISRSLVEQIKCRWREFRREPSAFFWVIFMPIVWMLALGFAFSEPKPEIYGIGWPQEQSASEFGNQVHEALMKSAQIKLREADTQELINHVKRGEISLIVSSESGKASYWLDAANPEARRARDYVDNLIQKAGGRTDPITTSEFPMQSQGGRYVDFLIPGLLGLSIMTSSLFGIAMTIVANRRENLLKRYMATPMRPWEYVVSHSIGRMIILTAEFLAVMVTGVLIFKFQVFGHWGSYILLTILGAAAFTAIAILCASRTKSIPMVSGITNLISLPMMMLSGVFFSKNNFPDWLQQGVAYLPLTALNDALRKIALEGQSLTQVSQEMLVLGGYFVVGSVLSLKLFKWY